MFDIYLMIPAGSGHLKSAMVAGNYKEWSEVLVAIHILNNVVMKRNISPIPIFVPQVCIHRKSSTHFKTVTSHTAPVTEEELSTLL